MTVALFDGEIEEAVVDGVVVDGVVVDVVVVDGVVFRRSEARC